MASIPLRPEEKLQGRIEAMSNEVEGLIQSRRYDEALSTLGVFSTDLETPQYLRLRRRCLARMGRPEEAALSGDALIRHPAGAADADDYFRQAQILLACGRWKDALKAGLAAGVANPGDDRLATPLAHAVLVEPDLFDGLMEGLGRLAPAEPANCSGREGNWNADPGHEGFSTESGRIFVPLRLPYYRPYDAAHPGTMGLIERAHGFAFHIPDQYPVPWSKALPAALRQGLAAMSSLMAIHPLVDRPTAARYVADRLPSLMAAPAGAKLDFLSNLPMTLGQRPWVLWFDILGTLFQPFFPIEGTHVTAEKTPLYWVIRSFLESQMCVAIITHYPIERHPLSTLFGSQSIDAKLTFLNPYHSLGKPTVSSPPVRRADGPVRMLFTSSFQNREEGFYHRGGVDVLCAFLELSKRFTDIELIVRGAFPTTLGKALRAAVLNHTRIRWIESYMPTDEYQTLMSTADLFLLPSVVLFRNGLVQAIEAGQVPVVSDVQGVEMLVRSGDNGLVVPGRSRSTVIGNGVFHNDWIPLLKAVDAPADPVFHAAFRAELAHLLENRTEIRRMSSRNLHHTARQSSQHIDVERFRSVMALSLRTAVQIGADGDRPRLPSYG